MLGNRSSPLTFCTVALLFPALYLSAFSQKRKLIRQVILKDDKKFRQGIIASVKEKTAAISTNETGEFSIKMPENSVLAFSSVEYVGLQQPPARMNVPIELFSVNQVFPNIILYQSFYSHHNHPQHES